MEEKKEPKYLELSASCDISVEEMLQRFFCPKQATDLSPGDEATPGENNG